MQPRGDSLILESLYYSIILGPAWAPVILNLKISYDKISNNRVDFAFIAEYPDHSYDLFCHEIRR